MKNHEENGPEKVMQNDAPNGEKGGGGHCQEELSSRGGDFGGPLIRAVLREGTPRHATSQARRGRGEARWQGDTKGEGEEATA